jgi:transposase-like protein
MAGGSSRRYPPELRERAVRMVAEVSDQHDSEWAAMGEVARLLGVGTAETVRKCVRQAQVDRRPYTVDGFKLGKWVATQRGSHGKGALDADRQRRLEELPGWTWKASSRPAQ